MHFRGWTLTTTALAGALAFCVPGVALAADPYSTPPAGQLPAVSGVNGSLSTFGGSILDYSAFGVAGTLAVPLGGQWGAQIDGMAGTAGGASFSGAAGHLFWRDPAKGLIGAYASYAGWGLSSTVPVSVPIGAVADVTGAKVGKVGIEAEAYLDRISLEGLFAYQSGSATGFSGRGTIAFYPTDNLRLDLSVRQLAGLGTLASAGFEWAPSSTSGLSVFGGGVVGPDGYWQALGGLKVYFGAPDKSLIRRHREDDPAGELPRDLFQLIGDEGYCPPGSLLSDGQEACDPI